MTYIIERELWQNLRTTLCDGAENATLQFSNNLYIVHHRKVGLIPLPLQISLVEF